jgi:hypothetical protein
VAFTASVAAALILGTLAVESSTIAWHPGSRTRMVQQVFQPLCYGSLVFALAGLVRIRYPKLAAFGEIGVMAILCAVAVLWGVDFNRTQRDMNATDRRLLQAVREVLPEIRTPTNVVIQMEGEIPTHWKRIAFRYAQTSYKTPLVNLRILEKGPSITRVEECNDIVFDSDTRGVQLWRADQTVGWVPYDEVVFLRYDGQRMILVDQLDVQDLAGYRVSFQRDVPAVAKHPVAAKTSARSQAFRTQTAASP